MEIIRNYYNEEDVQITLYNDGSALLYYEVDSEDEIEVEISAEEMAEFLNVIINKFFSNREKWVCVICKYLVASIFQQDTN